MTPRPSRTGTLALVGGAEWREGCAEFDAALLEASKGKEVVILPTAAAFEHPERAVENAAAHFEKLGAKVRGLMVLRRAEADGDEPEAVVDQARFVYLSGGSPLHLRSAIKGSRLWDALVRAYQRGAVLAGSSAGAMVLGDPMVDPRGGAYTVGLGLVAGLAVFPHQATAADHLRDRSIDLKPATAVLAAIDEQTALIRDPDGAWRVAGTGKVSIYAGTDREPAVYAADSLIDTLKM
jgi:cyanophycinase